VTGQHLHRASGEANADPNHAGEFQVSFVLKGDGARTLAI
jgi:hypothetical protein